MDETLRLILQELQSINRTLGAITNADKVSAPIADYTDILDRSIDKNSMVSTKEIVIDILKLGDEKTYRGFVSTIAQNMRDLGFDLKRLTKDGAKQYLWVYLGKPEEDKEAAVELEIIAPAQPVEEIPPATYEDCLILLNELVQRDRDAAVAILAKYGAKALRLADPSFYPHIWKDMDAAIKEFARGAVK